MGNNLSINKINFEDMQYYIKRNEIIISTLPITNQSCLIKNTLDPNLEIDRINSLIKKDRNIKIIIYGMNSSDDTLIKKYIQLNKLGFLNVSVYIGGLFEWLLLQDVFGNTEFPTTSQELDILKYKGNSKIKHFLISNGSS